MNKYVVIMAGGVGSRFWPRSRKSFPKQLLNIFGTQTMIQETVSRLNGFIETDRIFIVTNKVQKAVIEEQLPEIPSGNIIAEPVGRNTAPCIALAAGIISRIDKESVIITLPADHLIADRKKFTESLSLACSFAEQSGGLVTFGINPTRADTGYGYINFDKNEESPGIHKVIRFVEKPDYVTAQKYVDSGEYLWNSGMFVWRTDVILDELKRLLPDLSADVQKLSELSGTHHFDEVLAKYYPGIQNISIDYGVMEKSEKVYCARGDFGWSDVGSWETVYELSSKDNENNSLSGEVFIKKTSGSYIHSPEKFTAVIGLKDVVIIDTKDALLVCSRDNVQEVKDAVTYLSGKGREDLI